MTDQQIAQGAGPTPVAITVQGSEQLLPKLAFARYDGSGAGGDFLPVVRFIGPGGKVAGQAVGDVVTAGASVDQTWFRGLAKGGGSTSQTARERLLSPAPTNIGAGGVDYLDWNHNAGPSLLDLTNPQNPKVKADGIYAVTVTVVPDPMTVGACYQLRLQKFVPFSAFVNVTSAPSTVTEVQPYTSASLTVFYSSGHIMAAQILNQDAVAVNFGIAQADVQRIS